MGADAQGSQTGHSIILPGSVTDLAKALREIIGALRDVGTLISDSAKLVDKSKAKSAARHLNALAFTPDGSRRHLERIAAGQGTVEDLHAIGLRMADTADEVELSIKRLDKLRDRIREKFGMATASKLDEIVHGVSGKNALRITLMEIANAEDPAWAEEAAKWALQAIERLNANLTELHDMVLPPKGVS